MPHNIAAKGAFCPRACADAPDECLGDQADARDSSGHIRVRDQLPRTLNAWRLPPLGEDDHIAAVAEAVWKPLYPFFKEHGYTFWRHETGCILSPDTHEDSLAQYSNGFAYAIQCRGLGPAVGSVNDLFSFENLNPLCRAARNQASLDVVIRVLRIGDRGHEHVEILKAVSMGLNVFYNDNHAIPIFDFLDFEDITFGVFPKIGARVWEAYRYWAKNSVGDIVDMLLQCLEALAFVHSLGIAHRDAFKDNFLVQWQPESLKTGCIPRSRPRVYLTDFEVAIMFPEEMPLEECLVEGYPLGGSLTDDVKEYARPVPPEVSAGIRYNPFKLDVWQLGRSFDDFKSTIPEIDDMLAAMRLPDAPSRLSSFDALERLSQAVSKLTPDSLMIAPEIV